jgi:hypothetical protein
MSAFEARQKSSGLPSRFGAKAARLDQSLLNQTRESASASGSHFIDSDMRDWRRN